MLEQVVLARVEHASGGDRQHPSGGYREDHRLGGGRRPQPPRPRERTPERTRQQRGGRQAGPTTRTIPPATRPPAASGTRWPAGAASAARAPAAPRPAAPPSRTRTPASAATTGHMFAQHPRRRAISWARPSSSSWASRSIEAATLLHRFHPPAGTSALRSSRFYPIIRSRRPILPPCRGRTVAHRSGPRTTSEAPARRTGRSRLHVGPILAVGVLGFSPVGVRRTRSAFAGKPCRESGKAWRSEPRAASAGLGAAARPRAGGYRAARMDSAELLSSPPPSSTWRVVTTPSSATSA